MSAPRSNPLLPLLCALLWFASPLGAAPVQALFDASAPLAGRGEAEQRQAVVNAFGAMLIKVTGSRQVVSRPEVAAEMSKAQGYLLQYGFRDAAVTGAPGQPLLWASFDEAAVTARLQQLGIPIWGANRPSLLAWIAIKQGGTMRMMVPDIDTALRAGLEFGSNQRGLPLILPLQDLDDQAALPAERFVGGDERAVRLASGRYGPDLILAGTLSEGSDGWSGNWTLYSSGHKEQWRTQSPYPATLATDAVERVADLLAPQYTTAPPTTQGPTGGRLQLQVSGVGGLSDYGRVKHLLYQLNSVRSVELRAAASDALLFEIELSGPRSVMEREIELGGVLRPIPSAGAERLHYQMAGAATP